MRPTVGMVLDAPRHVCRQGQNVIKTETVFLTNGSWRMICSRSAKLCCAACNVPLGRAGKRHVPDVDSEFQPMRQQLANLLQIEEGDGAVQANA